MHQAMYTAQKWQLSCFLQIQKLDYINLMDSHNDDIKQKFN